MEAIRKNVDQLILVADVCLCEYTDHGHCGVIRDGVVENDAFSRTASENGVEPGSCAGADMVAPSDMMDGRVGAIRSKLDESHLDHIPIMSYAAKYCSAFYGPFREAAGFYAPQFGDRRGYQMDPPNVREALREIEIGSRRGRGHRYGQTGFGLPRCYPPRAECFQRADRGVSSEW